MKYMTINNRKVAFDDEKNVLSVIRKAGINLPTFCYHSELSTYGACRMCVVEDDRGKIFASCSEVPRDGMVIYTNTPKLQHHRKMILELMLSAHCRECTTCKKNGDCTLQNLAKQLGVSYIRFENNKPQIPIDESSDCIVIDKNKCILCGDCVRTCEEIQGLGILEDMQKEMEAAGTKVLSGEHAFKLYDTYGFPMDLTQEILEEKGFTIDEEGFKKCMEKQREKARSSRKETTYIGVDATVYDEIDTSITSEFVGYDRLVHESKITVLTTEREIVEALSDGDMGTVIVEQTPFYATMGGQCADHGFITTKDGKFQVEDVIKLRGGRIGHVGKMVSGMLKTGDVATLEVEEKRRSLTRRNHSATHLLQRALREVLGTHVEQHGSYVDDKRLRFDFSHFAAMTPEEIAKTEALVNEKIAEALPVETKIMSLDEAKKTGAMALFGEKYGESVRVVSMGDFSTELCAGTHVDNTSNISAFKIVSESGVAAGVRRIEALTSEGVFHYYDTLEDTLEQASKLVKTNPQSLVEKLEHLMAEMKALQSENESLKSKAAKEALGDVMDQVEEVKGTKLLAVRADGVDMNGLRDLGDQLKEKLGEGVIVLASECDGRVNLVAMATDAAMKSGAHAGNLIKAIAKTVGGGGGGRPNMAQAGGKNPAGIADALAQAKSALEEQLK